MGDGRFVEPDQPVIVPGQPPLPSRDSRPRPGTGGPPPPGPAVRGRDRTPGQTPGRELNLGQPPQPHHRTSWPPPSRLQSHPVPTLEGFPSRLPRPWGNISTLTQRSCHDLSCLLPLWLAHLLNISSTRHLSVLPQPSLLVLPKSSHHFQHSSIYHLFRIPRLYSSFRHFS